MLSAKKLEKYWKIAAEANIDKLCFILNTILRNELKAAGR